jgi:hypothetical protein
VIWVPLMVIGAALLPGLWGYMGHQFDHCSAHGGAHGHQLCMVHLPHAATDPMIGIIVSGLIAMCFLVVALFAIRVSRESRLAQTLVLLSQPTDWGTNVRLMDGPEPVACTVGTRRGTILLSRGLVDGLTPKQVSIVLAHEQAHVRRRDVITALGDRFASLLLPTVISRPLVNQITLAREQLCDAASASEVGSPLDVACTILAVARMGAYRPCVGHYFGDGELEARIQYLLSPAATSDRWKSGVLATLGVIVLLGVGPLHLAIEAATTAILH